MLLSKGATPFALSYSATPISSSPAPAPSSPAPTVGRPISVNNLPGRTEADYGLLVSQALIGAIEFYSNGNAAGYTQFNAINDLLITYGLQGDNLALEYYRQALNVESYQASIAAAAFS